MGRGEHLYTWLHVKDDICGCCSMHVNSLQQQLTMNKKREAPDVIFSENSGDNIIQQTLTLNKKRLSAGTI